MTASCPRQRFAVYHANDPWAMVEPSEDRWLRNSALLYRHVAEVEAHLERVFALTNHIEGHSWMSNREVVWYATNAPLRSTSVGDVILSRTTGQAWLVMPFELKEII